MSLLPQIERELLDAARRTGKGRGVTRARDPRGALVQRPASRRRTLLGTLAGAAAVTVGVVIALGVAGRGDGLNIAAAAYRAASASPGILHVVTETTRFDAAGHALRGSLRVETWSTVNQIRTLQTAGAREFEEAADGHHASTWDSAQPGVISTTTLGKTIGRPEDPAAALRAKYQAGRIHIVGRENLNGRAVWRLTVSSPLIRGRRAPSALIVVDAKTFVPIESIDYAAVALTPHGAFSVMGSTTTHYVVFEHLPDTARNRDLLRLAEHRGATVRHRAS